MMNRIFAPLALIAAMLLEVCCSRPDNNTANLPAMQAIRDTLTCVTTSPSDSSTLLLGSRGAHFTRYRISDGLTESYPLPDSTAGWSTYDILPVSPYEFLIAKRNHGVMYVRYADDSLGHRTPAHTAYVTSPDNGPLPHKDIRFSSYSLTKIDSLVVLGTSNGLMYLNRDSLARLATADKVHALYVKPLMSNRHKHFQFSQESVIPDHDHVITATDNGIFRIAIRDFDNDSINPFAIDSSLRCWGATMTNDSLKVIYTNGPRTRGVIAFARNGWQRGTPLNVDPATSWIGSYGDTVQYYGKQGDFKTQRTAVNAGGRFWFIRDAQLLCSDPQNPIDETSERIIFRHGKYGVSNHNGLWRLDDGKATFLGDLKSVSGIRDISTNSSHIYLACTNGIYRASLTDYYFAADREATLVDAIGTNDIDRAESVFATDTLIFVGTREGLHTFHPDHPDQKKPFHFPELARIYEQPYIYKIQGQQNGAVVIKTLNHGVWILPSAHYGSAVRGGIHDFTEEPQFYRHTLERGTTWSTITKQASSAIIGILSMIGLFYLIIRAIRMRHKLEMNAATEKAKRLDDTLAELRNEKDEAAKRDSKELGPELYATAKKIRAVIGLIPTDNPAYRVLSASLSDMETYLTATDPDSTLLEKAEAARRKVQDYCTSWTSRLYALSETTIPEGPLHAPLTEFATRIRPLGNASSASLGRRLKWIVDSAPALDQLLHASAKNIAAYVEARRPQAINTDSKDKLPIYPLQSLNELWTTCFAPFVKKIGKLNFSKTPFQGSLDENTLLALSLSFHGIREFKVSGDTMTSKDSDRKFICTRPLVRFDNTTNIGSVSKLWAQQLSDDCFRFAEQTVPSSPVELLWHVWLSKLSYDILRTNPDPDPDDINTVTLAHGIRYAFYDSHRLGLPPDISDRRKSRRRGRP